jgi:hypothetical protein
MKRPLRQLVIRVVVIASLMPVVLVYTDDWLYWVFGDPLDRIVRTTFVLVIISIAFTPPIWSWLMDVRRSRQLRRLHQRHCQNCNYDLRVHKPGDRCPECGSVIPDPPNPGRTEASR